MSSPATRQAIEMAKLKLAGLLILAAVDLVVIAFVGVPS